MTLHQKVSSIRESIQAQLDSVSFTTLGNPKINLSFIVDNNKPTNDEINVFEVSSMQEVEEIALAIYDSKSVINNVKNPNEPLYLTVLVILPR